MPEQQVQSPGHLCMQGQGQERWGEGVPHPPSPMGA